MSLSTLEMDWAHSPLTSISDVNEQEEVVDAENRSNKLSRVLQVLAPSMLALSSKGTSTAEFCDCGRKTREAAEDARARCV